MAASHDANAFCYNICWRLQGQRKEMIEDFRTIMKEHLQFFKKKNGTLPEEILYYRDGVSEGQFDQVMRIERNDMLQACREIEPGYEKKVKMTIVVVQKRHHTRLFPGNTGIGKEDRKNNNVPAGTIVDQVITRPNENYFYLVSHQSIQGVAKPTKYCILLDEGKHTIDELQGLTYDVIITISHLKCFTSKCSKIYNTKIFLFSCAICSRDAIVRCLIQHQLIMPIWQLLVAKFTSSKLNHLSQFFDLVVELTRYSLYFQKRAIEHERSSKRVGKTRDQRRNHQRPPDVLRLNDITIIQRLDFFCYSSSSLRYFNALF